MALGLFFTSNAYSAIYKHNPPVLNKYENSYLNEFVGKFIVRVETKGVNGALEDEYRSCTATLINPKWILTAAHCFRLETNGTEKPATELRFRFYHDTNDPQNYTSYRLTGQKIIGQYPVARHGDWAFFELTQPIQRPNYPKVVETQLRDWLKLDGSVFFVGFLKLDEDKDEDNRFSSRFLRTSTSLCATGKFEENLFIAYPEYVEELGILHADNSQFGTSDCPSTIITSGAPLFDQNGNIRAIDSFESEPNQRRYFGENKVNIHILSSSFFDAYITVMQTMNEQPPIVARAISNLNVRSGPGTQFQAVDQLQTGQTVSIEHCTQNGGWCRIEHAGSNGWVASQYLQMGE